MTREPVTTTVSVFAAALDWACAWLAAVNATALAAHINTRLDARKLVIGLSPLVTIFLMFAEGCNFGSAANARRIDRGHRAANRKNHGA